MIHVSIVRRTYNRHNRFLWMLVFVMVALFASVTGIRITAQDYLNRVWMSKTETYGAFSEIIYQHEITNSDAVLTWDAIGRIEAAHLQTDATQPLIIGTLNDVAKELAFPKSKAKTMANIEQNHCVITRSVAETSAFVAKAKNTMRLGDKEFFIDAVIEDYGYLWIRGESETQAQHYPPSIILNEQDYGKLKKFTSSNPYRILLLSSVTTKLDQLVKKGDSRYTNSNINMLGLEFLYALPSLFIYLTSISLILVLISLLFAYKFHSDRRYLILLQHGLQGKAFLHTRILDILCISVIPWIISLPITGMLTAVILTVAVGEVVFATMAVYLRNVFSVSTLYFLSVALFLFFSDLSDKKSLSRVSATAIEKKQIRATVNQAKILRSNMRVSLPLLSLWVIVGIAACFLVSLLFSRFELSKHRSENTNVGLGKLMPKADYQIMTISDNYPPMTAYFEGQYHDNSSSTETTVSYTYHDSQQQLNGLLAELQALEGISSVNAYVENYNMLSEISVPLAESPYIQTLFSSNVFNDQSPYWSEVFNLKGKRLIDSDLLSVSDNELREIAKTCSTEVEIDSLLEGKSALVLAPSFIYEREDISRPDGGTGFRIRYEKKKPDYPNAVFDTFTKKGDNIVLHYLTADSTAYGIFTTSQAKEIFTPQTIHSTVAGVIFDNVAWFGANHKTSPHAYRYLVSERFLSKHGYPTGATRIGIHLHSTAEPESIRYHINRLSSGYGQIDLVDFSSQLRMYHSAQVLKNAYKSVLLLLFLVLMLALSAAIAQAILARRKNYFKIYILLGMSKLRLFCLNYCSALLAFLAPALLVFGVYTWFMRSTSLANGDERWLIYSISLLLLYCLMLIIYAVQLFASVNQFYKQVLIDTES